MNQPATVTPCEQEIRPIRREVTLPPGDYVVGDPCYMIDRADWMAWLEAADYENESREHVLAANIDDALAVGVPTAHGDGAYVDQFGYEYGVDAGLIGAVPVHVADAATDSAYVTMGAVGVTVFTFNAPFRCYYDNGTVVIGHLRIDTDPDD